METVETLPKCKSARIGRNVDQLMRGRTRVQ